MVTLKNTVQAKQTTLVKERTTLQAFRKFLVLVSALTIALVACAPQQATESPERQVATSVAMTVSAIEGETATAQPLGTATSAPTEIPAVMPTLTPILSTPTAFVVASPPNAGGSGAGGSSSKPDYNCDPDIGKRPRDNEEFARGDKFDVKWTILNNGLKTWAAGKDLTYYSGSKMTTSTFVQLPEVRPGGTFSVVFDAVAPSIPGHYVMTWKLEGGFCWPYIAINVK